MKKIVLLILFLFYLSYGSDIAFFSINSSDVATQKVLENIVASKFINVLMPNDLKQLYKKEEIDTTKINFYLEDSLKLKYIIKLKVYDIKDSVQSFLTLPIMAKPLKIANYKLEILNVSNKNVVLNVEKSESVALGYRFWVGSSSNYVIDSQLKRELLINLYKKIVVDVNETLLNMSVNTGGQDG